MVQVPAVHLSRIRCHGDQRPGVGSLSAGMSLAVVPSAHHVCSASSICRNISRVRSGKAPLEGQVELGSWGASARSNPNLPTATKPGPALNLRSQTNIAAAFSFVRRLALTTQHARKALPNDQRTGESSILAPPASDARRPETQTARGPT